MDTGSDPRTEPVPPSALPMMIGQARIDCANVHLTAINIAKMSLHPELTAAAYSLSKRAMVFSGVLAAVRIIPVAPGVFVLRHGGLSWRVRLRAAVAILFGR